MSLLRDPAPCTQTYRMSIKDVEGEHYWTSSAIKEKFREDKDFCGTAETLYEYDFARHASRIITEGNVLSVHLKFYPQEDVNSAEASSSMPTDGTQPSDKNLGPNLKDLLLSEFKSDLTLIAEGREFKVHQAILVARSSVFRAMLDQGWLEQASGRVPITDCDAEVLQSFISYVYSGKVEKPTVGNVVDLFTLADMYDVKGLAEFCVDFMLSNLSVQNFCYFVPLAFRRFDSKQVKSANRFLAKNMKQIKDTEQWKDFAAQNPEIATDLMVNAMCQ